MTGNFRVFIFSLLLILFSGTIQQTLACTCVANITPCQKFTYADLIFIGKVTAVQPETEQKFRPGAVRTTFEVKDIISGEKVTQVAFRNEGSSCDVSFTEGETYLVFANKNGVQGYQTSLCSGNEKLSDAGETLAALRDLPKAGAGGRLFGNVSESFKKREKNSFPMAGVKLNIRQVGGKRKTYQAVTDEQGNYELMLPPGTYKVVPVVPAYATPGLYEESSISIKDRGCAEKSFSLSNNSSLSGRLVDARGRPVSGARLELLSVDEGPISPAVEEGFSEKGGQFDIYDIPAGRYTLSVNFTSPPGLSQPYPATFYPGKAEREKAKIIEIGLGQKIRNIVFRLPPPIPSRKITGTLVFPDGRPAAGMTVNLQREDSDTAFSYTKTDKDGNFILSGFIGGKYNFGVDYYGDEKEKDEFTIKKVVFTLDKNTPAFRLVLEKAIKR